MRSLIIDQVRPHPPVIRGVNLAVDKLRENGHNVIPWEPRKHDIGVDLFRRILTADGCAVSILIMLFECRGNIPDSLGCYGKHQRFQGTNNFQRQRASPVVQQRAQHE